MDISSISLCKWPQMIVTGESVDLRTAREIIRRTDDFFKWPTGNNRRFVKTVLDLVQFPQHSQYEDFSEYLQAKERWESNWGFISSEYVVNSWISCSFVGGPHGWCHPDGTIEYFDNIGKWPSVEAVLNDWKAIASAFPFLKVEVSLMSNERGCDTHPEISMLIREGEVELVDPSSRNIHEENHRCNLAKASESTDVSSMINNILLGFSNENAIPLNIIEGWARDFIDGARI